MVLPFDQAKERVQSRTPGSVGLSIDGGKVTWDYRVDEASAKDFFRAVTGDTKAGDNGRLKRKLPLMHPRPEFDNFYSERISDAYGYTKGREANWGGTPRGNVIDSYTRVDHWIARVEFLERPYAVLSDDQVAYRNVTWVNQFGNEQTNRITTEWQRFCDIWIEDESYIEEANQGSYYLARSNDPLPAGGVGAVPPHGFPFPGKPRLNVARDVVFINWYGTLYRYVSSSNSWLRKLKYHVNLETWMGAQPGDLLYEGYKVLKRYPRRYTNLFKLDDGPAQAPEMLCDVQLKISRKEPGLAGIVSNDPATGRVWGGHSAAPWFGNGRWYNLVMLSGDPEGHSVPKSDWRPLYASAPLELLFTDPEFVVPGP